MKLYGYWRSGTSYRVRIALALKGATIEQEPVNLLAGEHHSEAFRAKNPQGLVPALELDDGTILTQSPAIIEYLDETLPGPKLLPEDPLRRARARQLAAIIGCDIHPVQNLRILKYLQDPLGHDKETAFAWAAHWIDVGFEALEKELERTGWQGPFLLGAQPSVPDCYLLPQLYAGRRFGANVQHFPKLLQVEEALTAMPAVKDAHPDHQPDAQPC
ncbi:maleylacetoacetate isomerase [Parvularcula lutaonensis]|uniref:Maleylacetoacetate isomerase n=1 Tax=Parvularcula lutaonensis TaxID=491923 RepID=A0ABV7M7S5_9PROT|nr:maleylacetoacetate isomerase [Parvularcula lutaonensis]GGY42699.1 maleylacetoacetate isomerase [Parvularcula lutaonensis]